MIYIYNIYIYINNIIIIDKCIYCRTTDHCNNYFEYVSPKIVGVW